MKKYYVEKNYFINGDFKKTECVFVATTMKACRKYLEDLGYKPYFPCKKPCIYHSRSKWNGNASIQFNIREMIGDEPGLIDPWGTRQL